jgi:hypothetical protein
MLLVIPFSLLVISTLLLSAWPLPAQNAKFVVAPSGAGPAEQSKTSDASQSLRNTQSEMPKGITTNITTSTTTNKLKAKILFGTSTVLVHCYVDFVVLLPCWALLHPVNL